jgi:Tol biopolymer transport system component
MTKRRRNLFLAGGLVAVVVVAAAIGVGIAVGGGDEDSKLAYPGRIGVRNGCGLTNFFQDGSDQAELCLTDVWDAVSLSWNGDQLAWDTRDQGIRVGDYDDPSEPVNLSTPQGTNYAPSLSPDAKRVAFLHSPRDDGRYDIWVVDAPGGDANAEQVTIGRNVSDVSWSPKGDWLAYVRDWSDETLEGQISLVRPDGTDAHTLVRGDAPEWAPDGEHLVYVHNESIWTIGSDGEDAQMIVPNGHAPAWSRDGEQIAFMRAERCGEAICPEHVFLAFANGTGVRQIGPEFAGERIVLWLPDPLE